MTTTISTLPKDLVEEIISRVPMKFMRAVRLICKKWNALFKSLSFTKMHIDKEEAAAKELGETRKIVMMDYNLYLMGIVVNEKPSVESLGKLTCLDSSVEVKISQVFHSEGLLLCILKDDDSKIVVWNPYLGQTKWIKTRKYHLSAKKYNHAWKGRNLYKYALGYGNNSENSFCCNPKILSFVDDFRIYSEKPTLQYEIYDFDSDLWTTLDVTPHWSIISKHGISLKGNTYWGAVKRNTSYGLIDHIICFDFTKEVFGPLLHLPFKAWGAQFGSLSSVREEKIASLFQSSETYKVEIWITTKIETNNVSWSNLFTLNTTYMDDKLLYQSFFIDEEKKDAVLFDKEGNSICDFTHNTIYIIGEAGCLRKLELGETAEKKCWPHVCSYVPSTVQVKQHKGCKRKKQSD